MASINMSTVHSSSSLRLHFPFSFTRIPKFSYCSHIRPSLSFHSISLKPIYPGRPRVVTIVSAVNKLSETERVAVPPEAEDLAGKLSPDSGVYAVYDKNDDLQFIGISRNVAASVVSHIKSVPELCHSVKVFHASYLHVCNLFTLSAISTILAKFWKRKDVPIFYCWILLNMLSK